MILALETEMAKKILWAWHDGCPVAASSEKRAFEMASYARRRWNSYERRNKTRSSTMEGQINDLAKGLAGTFTEGGLPMVGPLIVDYKWLSEQISLILHNRS